MFFFVCTVVVSCYDTAELKKTHQLHKSPTVLKQIILLLFPVYLPTFFVIEEIKPCRLEIWYNYGRKKIPAIDKTKNSRLSTYGTTLQGTTNPWNYSYSDNACFMLVKSLSL